MYQPDMRPPRWPILFFAGVLIYIISTIGVLVFAVFVGFNSVEFHKYFIYFIGSYMVGTTIIMISK